MRPITGLDEVTVQRCGKNLLNENELRIQSNYDTSHGASGFWYYKLNLPFGSYAISAGATCKCEGYLWIGNALYGTDGVVGRWIAHPSMGLEASHIFTDVDELYIGVSDNMKLILSTLDAVKYLQIEPGSTPTSYAPYTGTTATLSLPSTVYGGEVDVATGQGQETYAMVELDGTESILITGTNTDGVVRYNFGNDLLPGVAVPTINNIVFDGVCSHYLVRSADDTHLTRQGASINSSGAFIIYDPNFANETDATAFKAYLAAQAAAGTPVMVAYKLATPQPITATGGQQINALAGVNTVMTDADGVTVTFLREDGNEQANVTGSFADSSDGYASTVSEMNEISISGEDVELTKLEIDYVPQVR